MNARTVSMSLANTVMGGNFKIHSKVTKDMQYEYAIKTFNPTAGISNSGPGGPKLVWFMDFCMVLQKNHPMKRCFRDPKMVPLWHRSHKPYSVPTGTFILKSAHRNTSEPYSLLLIRDLLYSVCTFITIVSLFSTSFPLPFSQLIIV